MSSLLTLWLCDSIRTHGLSIKIRLTNYLKSISGVCSSCYESSSVVSLKCHKPFPGWTELSKEVSFLRLMPQNRSDLKIQFLNLFFFIISLQKQKWQRIPLAVCTFIHTLVVWRLAGLICGTLGYFLLDLVIFSTVAFRFQV